MTPDPTAVRAAAEQLDRNWYDEFNCTEEGLSRECVDAIRRVADAYLSLTDPTPLSVDVLVGMGLERVVDTVGLSGVVVTTLRYRNLDVSLSNSDWQLWCFNPRTDAYFHLPKSLQPRTVGELRQLLERMGK